MRLIKYKVHKFRSVKETDWITIDQLACFVGENEAGKTNLLLPLWKFNPADGATKIDKRRDYPRDEHSQFEESEDFIEVLFKLEIADIMLLIRLIRQAIKDRHSIVTKDEEGVNMEAITRRPRMVLQLDRLVKVTEHLLIRKDYSNQFHIFIADEQAKIQGGYEIEKLAGKAVHEGMCEMIPRFIYYSDYGNLSSYLDLPTTIANLDQPEGLTEQQRMEAQTLKTLFKYGQIDPQEILELGREDQDDRSPARIKQEKENQQARDDILDTLSHQVTKDFNKWWNQSEYTFHFQANGSIFSINVSDEKREKPIELELRSYGLQWIFSFFLVFTVESKATHKNCVLLLDEPGLRLHPKAQIDLVQFFQQLSTENQLLYTTHLPFLVDHNHLDKIKVVGIEKGNTKVFNDLDKISGSKPALLPVMAAIGINLFESLLIGCQVVLVEGVTDRSYLTMIKDFLIDRGKFNPKETLRFIPLNGTKNAKLMVSMLQGVNDSLPLIILDSDKEGRRTQKDLKNGFYQSDPSKVLNIEQFIGKEYTEIEDLMPIPLIVENFNDLFKSKSWFIEKTIDESLPIIPQLKKMAKDNQLDHKCQQGWKFKLSENIKQRFREKDVKENLQEIWIKLFKKLTTKG